MKLTQQNRDTIERVRLISGSTYESCKDFFESLFAFCIFNYLDNKETNIPYLGNMKIEYDGDSITPSGRIANIVLKMEPEMNIKRVIGQLVDGEETDIERIFMRKMKNELEGIVDGKNIK